MLKSVRSVRRSIEIARTRMEARKRIRHARALPARAAAVRDGGGGGGGGASLRAGQRDTPASSISGAKTANEPALMCAGSWYPTRSSDSVPRGLLLTHERSTSATTAMTRNTPTAMPALKIPPASSQPASAIPPEGRATGAKTRQRASEPPACGQCNQIANRLAAVQRPPTSVSSICFSLSAVGDSERPARMMMLMRRVSASPRMRS